MAIDTLNKLKARIGFLANRDDMFSTISIGVVDIESAVDTAIGNATTTITRDLAKNGGVGLQETVDNTLVTASGTETISLPATTAAVKFFAITTNPYQVLQAKDYTTLINDNLSTTVGKPTSYSIVNLTTAYLRPIPDAIYATRLIYWKKLATLTTSVTNPVFDNYPDIYEACSMVELSLALEDDAALNKWRVVYEQKLNDLTGQDALAGWAAAISGATPSVNVVIA